MRVSILASGSNGNATLIETENDSFLIDDGLSFKNLYSRVCECQNDIHKLSSIFLTHEHIDHVSGLKVLLKRIPLKCYLSKGTYEGLNVETRTQIDLNDFVFVKNGDEVLLNDCKIKVLQTHHDAREPIGFVIEEQDKKVVYITDTGYVDQSYFSILKNADMYIMESNYDVELLWSSARPFDLKKRIDGDYGHMSNVTSAVLLSKLIGPKTKNIVLAHISDDCNYYGMPSLILNEHKKIYDETGVDYSNIKFYYGNRFNVTGVFEI
jgi:phosphoribosyl 1,2-cyclic phosphodiesterase